MVTLTSQTVGSLSYEGTTQADSIGDMTSDNLLSCNNLVLKVHRAAKRICCHQAETTPATRREAGCQGELLICKCCVDALRAPMC